MDWRVLGQNQWFQLCGLVAVLSVGALGYDLAAGRFGGSGQAHSVPPTPGSTPVPKFAPIPTVKLNAKTRGRWIVDATGAADSDGRDLRSVVASAADGDTITIRPGNYDGGLEITKNIRLIGQGNVGIHAATQNCVSVTGRQVVLEHLTIGYDATDDQFCTLSVTQNGGVELNDCLIGSKGKFNALALGHATVNAQDSKFKTLNTGCAIKYQDNTRGTLARCEFSFNNWGVEAVNAAQIEVDNCSFTKNGLVNGNGNTMAVEGDQARAVVNFCTFTNNTASILVSENGTLYANGCSFHDNGVSGETGNSNEGLLSARSGAKVTFNNATLASNKQGFSAFGGASLNLSQVKITGTGIQTDNDTLKYYARAIYATEQGTTVALSNCTIADSVFDGIMILNGASLTAQDSTVTNSNSNGLALGYDKGASSHAELIRTHFLGNHAAGIWVHSGSSVAAQNSEFSGNGESGVEISDANTQARIADSTCRNNKDSGLFSHDAALLLATGCTLEGNGRGAQAGIGNTAERRASMELDNCTVRANTIFGIGACAQSSITFQGGFLGGQRQNVYKESGALVRQTR